MSTRLYLGETMKIVLRVRDADGVLFNPDALEIKAVSPSGAEIVHDLSDVEPSIFQESTGVFTTYFTVDEVGDWVAIATSTFEENGVDVIDIEQITRSVYKKATD